MVCPSALGITFEVVIWLLLFDPLSFCLIISLFVPSGIASPQVLEPCAQRFTIAQIRRTFPRMKWIPVRSSCPEPFLPPLGFSVLVRTSIGEVAVGSRVTEQTYNTSPQITGQVDCWALFGSPKASEIFKPYP